MTIAAIQANPDRPEPVAMICPSNGVMVVFARNRRNVQTANTTMPGIIKTSMYGAAFSATKLRADRSDCAEATEMGEPKQEGDASRPGDPMCPYDLSVGS